MRRFFDQPIADSPGATEKKNVPSTYHLTFRDANTERSVQVCVGPQTETNNILFDTDHQGWYHTRS